MECTAIVPATGITIYGCGRDEAVMFEQIATRFRVRPTITDAAPSEANVDLVRGDHCISIGHKTPVSRPTLDALSRVGVRYISTRSIGYNHIDVDHAARLGIQVGNVAYSPDSVADYTLMLILMAIRQTRSVLTRTAAHDYRLGDVRGRELRDLTVGVVGVGHIGSAVIDRLRGFGSRVLAHDLRPHQRVEQVSLETLLRYSDVVTLHTPLTEQTHHLLDADRLEQVKPSAIVVNTGRGGLVDTDALLSALEGGRLGGAALDVVEGEEGVFYTDRRSAPVASDRLIRLQSLESVIITPHTAFYTDHALRDTVENSLINCLRFEGGRKHG